MDYKKLAILVALVFIAGYIWNTYFTSKGETKIYRNAEQQVLTNSIASLQKLYIGGSEQWVLIRGKNIDNPILLFLSDGPGQSEMVWFRYYNAALENYFTVVTWDQRGTGKSYAAIYPLSNITLAKYESDTIELTRYLLERFNKQKLFIAGHGFGGMLGLLCVQKAPELYSSIAVSGLMVHPSENDTQGYLYTLKKAFMNNNTNALSELKALGKPPYTNSSFIEKYGKLSEWEAKLGLGDKPKTDFSTNWFNTINRSPEYSLDDKKNIWKGYFEVYSELYPKIRDLDLAVTVREIKVPILFIHGTLDYISSQLLARNYYHTLTAPKKEWEWYDGSGHSLCFDEFSRFNQSLVSFMISNR
jgi:pimeloyl-ACP methyl ester carboxylesterase